MDIRKACTHVLLKYLILRLFHSFPCPPHMLDSVELSKLVPFSETSKFIENGVVKQVLF